MVRVTTHTIIGLMAVIILSAACLIFYKTHNTRATTPTTSASTQEQAIPAGKQAAIIVDLPGILFAVNKQQALSQLGFLDTLAYTLSGKKTTDLEDKIIEFLALMRPEFKTYHCKLHTEIPGMPIPHLNGKPLPMIMRDWIQGELSSKQILDAADRWADKLDKQKFFSSPNEKKLIKKTLTMIFDPHIRRKLSQPIKSAIKLVTQCKKLGHKVFLLTNMDAAFITLMEEKYTDLFEQFDGVMVSGCVHLIKPNQPIFRHLITTYNLNPRNCYVIDDHEENLAAAKKCGMNPIACDEHFVSVRKALRKAGVLPNKNDQE